ncbi:MAG: 1-acyl-sn-glycerol-3-phosphate acyltransferase [Vicinamibacterales bacterium]
MSHEEVVRYLQGGHGHALPQARERIEGYLDELRTTQRYSFYRILKHPLYPILRKVDRRAEGIEWVRRATGEGRVVYVSNHKSHLDYLIEPLLLEDNSVRPPIIAAGINMFGGPLGLLHKHVTGAIPIRRNTKDPAYLITLKAYVAEVLRRHDLFFYIEGGRSYSGEIKAAKTGLVQAILQAGCPSISVVPTAIAYDLVLEDRILSHQGVKKVQRPFKRELGEMVRQAVGYWSRAFVTFGEPIPAAGYGQSRRAALDLAHTVREKFGRLYKVLPTALVAAALRPSMTMGDLESRMVDLLALLDSRGANLLTTDPREAAQEGARLLADRQVLLLEGDRVRVRDRITLRYYARTISHLIAAASPDPEPDRQAGPSDS